MLHLSKLELSGFKSFVDPVTVEFPSGITAIVGPNGCGKSNLSDAITWVLGEQSAKSLRGSKMEDVIFNGSGKRRPVGMAEVEITLTTDTEVAASVDGQIVIGRRVFRSGEGQYLLNGKLVRLKEIRDHLMDTGLGIRAYSVIEQGRIGMILSGKPQERRKLLEEAAGITRYKSRKRIAEIKLEEALGNLTRLDDLISEIGRGLRSLKRQAGAARRFKENQERFEKLLEEFLSSQLLQLATQIREVDSRLDDRLDEDSERDSELSTKEAALTSGREQLDVLSQKLAERHSEHAEISAKIEGRQEFISSSRRRLEEMGERLDSGQKHATERRRLESEYRTSLGSLDQRAKDLVAERDAAKNSVHEQDRRIEQALAELHTAEKSRDQERSQALAALGKLNEESGRVQASVIEVEKSTLRLAMLEEESEQLTELLEEASRKQSAAEAEIGRLTETLKVRTEESESSGQELLELTNQETAHGNRKQELQSELAALRQRHSLLAELEQESQEQRRNRLEELAKLGIDSPAFLSDRLGKVEGWEGAIDHFLGELLEALVVEPSVNVIGLARQLAEHRLTAAFLVPLDGPAPVLGDQIPGVPLGQAMGLENGLADALPPARLVEDAEHAARLAREFPGVAFLSKEGIWTSAGTLRSAGDAVATGTLSRRSELDRLAELIPNREQELQTVTERLTNLRPRVSEAGERLRSCQRKEQQARQQLAVAESQHSELVKRGSVQDERYQSIGVEQVNLTEKMRQQRADQKVLRAEVARITARVEELNRVVAESEDGLAQLRAVLESLRTERASRQGRLELIQERLTSQTRQVTEIKGQIRYTEKQLEIWAAENENLEERRSGLETAIETAVGELGTYLGQSEGAQEAVLKAQQAAQVSRDQLSELERLVRELRATRDEGRQQTESLRIQRARIQQQLKDIARRYQEEANGELEEAYRLLVAPPESIASETGLSGEAASTETPAIGSTADTRSAYRLAFDQLEVRQIDEHHLGELEMELARCRAVLDRIGPVNLLAAEEHDEQQERFDFLNQQRKDVADSVGSIKSTIAEINETSSVRFKETFEQVNTRFNSVFVSLFRGGEAEMRLLDEDDILESGIEIIARPPGKREQNLMLLSGGEKALTAIALLFALFQTKPSPFCILDEVDAPLDDINVTRFLEVLQEMAGSTQFLMITHNKLTMEVARSLYGVTMEEKGISKIVGVEIDEIHPSRAVSA